MQAPEWQLGTSHMKMQDNFSLAWTPTETFSSNCQDTDIFMVQACHAPQQPLQNHCSGQVRGWAMQWMAEEMLNGPHQTVDILAHARTANDDLLQKRVKKDICRIIHHAPSSTWVVKGLNWILKINQKETAPEDRCSKMRRRIPSTTARSSDSRRVKVSSSLTVWLVWSVAPDCPLAMMAVLCNDKLPRAANSQATSSTLKKKYAVVLHWLAVYTNIGFCL